MVKKSSLKSTEYRLDLFCILLLVHDKGHHVKSQIKQIMFMS